MISLSVADLNDGGTLGQRKLIVYGDGRVIRFASGTLSDNGLPAAEQGTLINGGLQRLLDEAAAEGILARWSLPPLPLHTGGTSLRFNLSSGRLLISPRDEGSVGDDRIPATEELIDKISSFRQRLWNLDGVVTPGSWKPYVPQGLLVLASRKSLPDPELGDSAAPQRWPLEDSPAEAFQGRACTVLTGTDAARMFAEVSTAPTMTIVVSAGAALPSLVRIDASVAFPDEGDPAREVTCPESRSANRPQPPSPWPGAERRVATVWELWAGWDGLERAGFAGRLGASDIAPISSARYAMTASVAQVDGRAVVDVIGRAVEGSRAQQQEVAARVALDNGEVLEVQYS